MRVGEIAPVMRVGEIACVSQPSAAEAGCIFLNPVMVQEQWWGRHRRRRGAGS